MGGIFKLTLLALICIKISHAMIMRNNDLMSKMVWHFQKDNNLSSEPISSITPKPNVIKLLQSVLCKNFPSIPCDLITHDETLRRLIQKSIQQINHKKLSLEKTTASPGYHLTLFPVINSEDLSHYLEENDAGYYNKGKKRFGNKKQKSVQTFNVYSREKTSKKKNKKKESKRTALNGRKRIRKFYPHKIKYKDKNMKEGRHNTEEKLSTSVEIPDMALRKKHNHFNFKMEPNPPVWRIDYMKHGDPNINMFGYESDGLKDTSTGQPAAGLFVELYKKKETWTLWHSSTTNGDGRIQFPFSKDSMSEGTYKLTFKVGDYYKSLDKETLYPYVEIVFEVKEGQHYHIPLLLSPYGYTTYRGS